MTNLLLALKALIPVLEPLGEQGINQLWTTVVDPYIATLSSNADVKTLLQCLSPAMKQFVITEIQKLKV